MTYQDEDFILVGSFGRPIGLKGSLKLNSFTRPPNNIKNYNSFFLKENNEFVKIEVNKINVSGKNLVIFLNSCFAEINISSISLYVTNGFCVDIILYLYLFLNRLHNLFLSFWVPGNGDNDVDGE